MNCFTGFIGLHGYDEDKAASGLFVDELPGMGEELALAVSRHDGKGEITEAEEIAQVWERVEKRATIKLMEGIKSKANEENTWHELLFQSPKPKLHRPISYVPTTAQYTGLQVSLPDSKHAAVYIKNIVVYSQSEALAKEFLIVDLYTGKIIETVTAGLNEGLNVVAVNKSVTTGFEGGYIGVFVDTSDISLATFKDDTGCGCGDWAEAHAVSLPLEGLMIDDNTGKLNDVAMFLDIEVRCDIEAYACENKNLFKTALWYLCGAELLAEKIHSPNVNWFVQSNIAETIELQKELKHEYSRLIKQAVKAIPLDSLCVTCAPEKGGVFMGSPMP